MGESKKSFFSPSFPKKYKGNPNNIICRSTWETKFCNYCDLNENILEWASEEFYIRYISPVDNRSHRYYPDFLIKVKENNGSIKTYVIEVKPKKQTRPPKPVERKTKRWIKEVRTFGINEAKWKHASKWCKDNDMEFKILTEEELGIRYK